MNRWKWFNYMKLSLILARSLNDVIGNKNKLVWHSETDLKWFQENTKNKICIMGYNTFESMKKYKRFFKDRIVFVITSKADYINENALYVDDDSGEFYWITTDFVRDKEQCLEHISKLISMQEVFEKEHGFNFSEIMVIGGQSIYNQFYPYCSKIYLTTVYHEVNGDTFFNKDLMIDWKTEEMIPYKDKNGLIGMLEVYTRIDSVEEF